MCQIKYVTQVSDEDDLVREGLPEQTFSNVPLTREPVQTKVKKDEQATSKSYCSCGMSWCALGPALGPENGLLL